MNPRDAEIIAAALTVIALQDSTIDSAEVAWTSAHKKLTDLWDEDPDSYVVPPDATEPSSFEPEVT